MAPVAKRKVRDPEATRAAILEAAFDLLAQDSGEGLSLSAVAVRAGVNRGTAYQHFETREKLIAAARQEVSDQMFRAVFGDPDQVGERDVEQVDMVEVTLRLVSFAMDNPRLSRVWLLQMLALPDPSSDPFWREYVGSIRRFADTPLAEDDIDVDVMSVIFLAGNFLWPVWAQTRARTEEERAVLADRFTREILRLSLYGSVKEDKVPQVVEAIGKESRLDRAKALSTVK